jgi:alanyl-tRNA synthetase
MTANEIRAKYLDFFKTKGHKVVPRANLVPQDDPTTLFTGSGMQPMVPYLLGAKHPLGNRLADSQPSFREVDINEVGDNRHTTFFEMLGNWSLGDYFKSEQIEWIFSFLVDEIGIDPKRLYASACIGDKQFDVPKDTEAAELWQKQFKKKGIEAKIVELGSQADGNRLGMQGGRIFYYDVKENWWSRTGAPSDMPEGEPGGSDSEVFYEFTEVEHNPKYGKHCHPACDCGRFLEIGNSVFMQYKKTKKGFDELPKKNIDFGGGLERIAAASINNPDVFKIDLIWPIIEKLQELSGKKYEDHVEAKRIIADHMRSAVFMTADGVAPGNTGQGYVLRRLLRRAIRQGLELGMEHGLFDAVTPIVVSIYKDAYPEISERQRGVLNALDKEEKLFRQTLRNGLRVLDRLLVSQDKNQDQGKLVFTLFDTYGFPPELSLEELKKKGIKINPNWKKDYQKELDKQKDRSRTAAKGMFKGGLAEHTEITTKYHTATHMMYKALRGVLGDHVIQRGSNITNERLRFDFSHPEKMTPEEIAKVEQIVNENIKKDWPVSWREVETKKALEQGVLGAFGDRYGDKVKVYTVGDPEGEWYSQEICGGPHVEHTGALAEGNKTFKISKEESSSAGIRRIKAVLQ